MSAAAQALVVCCWSLSPLDPPVSIPRAVHTHAPSVRIADVYAAASCSARTWCCTATERCAAQHSTAVVYRAGEAGSTDQDSFFYKRKKINN